MDASIDAGEKDPRDEEDAGALMVAKDGASAVATAPDRRFLLDRAVRQWTSHHSIGDTR